MEKVVGNEETKQANNPIKKMLCFNNNKGNIQLKILL